jgi:hypothetical protein
VATTVLASSVRVLDVSASALVASAIRTACTWLTGCAKAVADSPPLARTAVTAKIGALSATMILDLSEGCEGSRGCDDNRELSAGRAHWRAQLSPKTSASTGSGASAFRRFKAIPVTLSNPPDTQGAFVLSTMPQLLDARAPNAEKLTMKWVTPAIRSRSAIAR